MKNALKKSFLGKLVICSTYIFIVSCARVIETDHEARIKLRSGSTALSEKNRKLQNQISQAITSTANYIRSILEDDKTLAPTYIRLAFHDCVGGCDGCVDLENSDNNGLERAIDSLANLVASNENQETGLTRADIWALAAVTGANFANPESDSFFEFYFYGRTNCEDNDSACLDVVDCSAKAGPSRILPPANADTEDVLDFFNDEFGYTDEETVALLGVHTIGVASQSNSGFDGPFGWTPNNDELDNAYYKQIAGPQDDLIYGAKLWHQKRVSADRYQWERQRSDGKILMMLNSDVALARTYGFNLDPFTGEVFCSFKEFNICRPAKTLEQAGIYRSSNSQWKNDFKAVFEKMLVHGYYEVGCQGPTCLQFVDNSDCRIDRKRVRNSLTHLFQNWL